MTNITIRDINKVIEIIDFMVIKKVINVYFYNLIIKGIKVDCVKEKVDDN